MPHAFTQKHWWHVDYKSTCHSVVTECNETQCVVNLKLTTAKLYDDFMIVC